MPRHRPLLAILAMLITAVPSLAQSGIYGHGVPFNWTPLNPPPAECFRLRVEVEAPPAKPLELSHESSRAGVPALPQTQEGRVVIQFRYRTPAGPGPSSWRQALSENTYGWIPRPPSRDWALQDLLTYRDGLLRLGVCWPSPAVVSPGSYRAPWPAGAEITSVQVIGEDETLLDLSPRSFCHPVWRFYEDLNTNGVAGAGIAFAF